MWTEAVASVKHWGSRCGAVVQRHVVRWMQPPHPGLLRGTLTDTARSKPQLIAENALLRQQLLVLRRQVQRPRCTPADRLLVVLLARCVPSWKEALLIVQPATLLRWHRAGFRLVWRARSRAATTQPKIARETIALIREMAAANRLWGAERIRGELLKLGIRVSKHTIQKYMRGARPPRRSGQTWATFLVAALDKATRRTRTLADWAVAARLVAHAAEKQLLFDAVDRLPTAPAVLLDRAELARLRQGLERLQEERVALEGAWGDALRRTNVAQSVELDNALRFAGERARTCFGLEQLRVFELAEGRRLWR